MPTEPVLTVLMLTQPSRDKVRAAAWAALHDQTGVDADVEIVVLADEGCTLDLPKPAWATRVDTYVKTWPTLTDKLNDGFRLADGAFVTFWDDDDWAERARIAKTLAAISGECADIYGPAQLIRHELLSTTRRTFRYTAPWGLPCLSGTVIHRDLVLRRPFEVLHAKPTEHNLSAWLLAQKKDTDVDFAALDVDIVAMAMGGVNAPRAYRVDEVNGRVLNGNEYQLLGGADEATRIMGADLIRFEAAVR